ncbi:MAG: DUF2934 domain-containing protein [Chthoniobacteraceae bacterium]
MGKKTSNEKPAAPAKRAAKTKPAAEKAAAPEPVPAKPKAVARRTKPVAPRTRKVKYSQEDVALRAYFIAERRQAAGLAGDAHQDWIEAERQLASEASATGKAKPKKR